MSLRSLRYRQHESNNIWPGFVDVLATLLIVIIFVLMIFTVSQIYLSDAISGKDKALQNLRNQIDQLSKILVVETQNKEIALSSLIQREEDLLKTQTDLQNQKAFSKSLQTDIAKRETEIFVQDQNIIALSGQIKNLLGELRIVAKVLEVYEGVDIVSLSTEGLGERINKALATRINQLNQLNLNLDQSNILLEASETNLENKISDLDQVNNQLAFNEIELKNKVEELNNLNNNLTAINDSLGLGDAELLEQLAAIQKKMNN